MPIFFNLTGHILIAELPPIPSLQKVYTEEHCVRKSRFSGAKQTEKGNTILK